MKRMITTLLVAAALLGSVGCAAKEPGVKSLKEKGLDIAAKLDFMAESDELTALFAAPDAIRDVVVEMGGQEYGAPRRVFAVTGIKQAMLRQLSGEASLRPELIDLLGDRLSQALSSQMNAMNGADYLAAAGIVTYGESFIFQGLSEPATYLYLYEEPYSVAVHFTPFPDDIVAASGGFLLNPSFAAVDTEEEMTSLLRRYGIEGAAVAPID